MADTPISPAAGSVSVNGYAPGIGQVIPIPSAGSIAIIGQRATPVEYTQIVVTPGYGSIVITEYAPRLHGWADVSASSTTWTNL